ncbi:MAG: Hpt domain-containing protein, partial [Methanomicrobiales archaeon]
YIPKPFKASQLISVIAKAAGREIRFSEKRISPAEPERGKETGVTDLTYLEKFCGGDKEKMQKYITMFLASAPMLIEKINGALNDRDLQEIASQVHGHKTRFIMMGMQGSKNLADIIERQCREEVKPEEISENVMNLVQQIDKAISELQLT